MSYVVFKLVISEYGLHLMHFLITLNINEMYNLTYLKLTIILYILQNFINTYHICFFSFILIIKSIILISSITNYMLFCF